MSDAPRYEPLDLSISLGSKKGTISMMVDMSDPFLAVKVGRAVSVWLLEHGESAS